MDRKRAFEILEKGEPWDVLIIGGGATGLGCAVDAASRGYKTLLLEQHDFAKGTSSRSTKLIHGGLRYLEQAHLSLVFDALKERSLLCRNAPHLVGKRAFIIPHYRFWEAPFYGIGVKVYDLMARQNRFPKSRSLSREEVIAKLPNVKKEGLRGGTLYYDGQFDDSRLAVTLAQTAWDLGAVPLNYIKVTRFIEEEKRAVGVHAVDQESGKEYAIYAKTLINATGVFCDQVRQLEEASQSPIIKPSQGIHIVLPRYFLGGDSALLIPHTPDRRVLFLVPWHDHLVVGTTDTAKISIALEPKPLEEEVDFILETAARYLDRTPTRGDILAQFAGLRPLFAPHSGKKSGKIARDHHIEVGPKGVITVCGGKWTTYRKMAEDTLDCAIAQGKLPQSACKTHHLQLHAFLEGVDPEDFESAYGSDFDALQALIQARPELGALIHPAFPLQKAHVVWACQNEMALHVEDLLARRSRLLFLNAQAAIQAAPLVAAIMAQELGKDASWIQTECARFESLAHHYLVAEKAHPC